MRRREFAIGALGAFSAVQWAQAQTNTFALPTQTQQGAVLRGRAPVGSTIQIGSLVAPFEADASGDFIVGLSRSAPQSVTVRCTQSGAALSEVVLTVQQRTYLTVTITGTGRTAAAGDQQSAIAPNSEFGAFFGDDLFDGGDPELPQDAGERAGVVSRTQQERETRAARIAREAAAKRAAFASRLPGTGYREEFVWPLVGRITSQWGAQRIIVPTGGEPRPSTPHGGVDIRGITGAAIVAPASGVVVLADPDYFYEGGVAFIDHGQGLISAYLHMSAVDVHAGQSIAKGARIGAVGASGRATGPHLCWRMKWRGVDVDPTTLLGMPS
ncbi:MAG: M23 family metallopeptidase [Hyphomonadaceae bacterium JAD_PAG50586_4]|nr:MAG: M23 family metallopeptidase [Hyphomonadaceae bacterium JAD_PAG50586_4]